MNPRFFPIALKLHHRRCLVVGSGANARARARTLPEHGAEVLILTADASDDWQPLTDHPNARLTSGRFREELLEGVWLAVLSDPNAELAATLGRACERRNVFFCAVDQPEHSSFSHVASVRTGPLSVSISSDGQAPALAKRLRQEFERLLLTPEFQHFVERVAELRRDAPPGQRGATLEPLLREFGLDGRLRLPKLPPEE